MTIRAKRWIMVLYPNGVVRRSGAKMYAALWSQGDRFAAFNLLGAEHDVLRAHWAALGRPVEGEDVRQARNSVENMLALLDQHFQNEELLMRTLRYPDFHGHKIDHQRLIGDFEAVLNDSSEISENWPQVVSLLQNWYLEHGRAQDARLQAYVSDILSNDNLQ